MGRAKSPIMPEGRRVVWPKCNFSKEPYREGLSRLDIRRRCCRSRTEGGGGPESSTRHRGRATSRRIEDVAVAENKRGGRLDLCSRRRCVKSLAYTASEVVGGVGRAQSPIMPEGRRVVWPKCNFSKESYREGLSRLDIRRRCCCSRTKVVCREGERRW
jgi:hypothetical protein